MTSGTISVGRGVIVAAAVGLLLTGSVATLLWLRTGGGPSQSPMATSQAATMPGTTGGGPSPSESPQAGQAPAQPVETVVSLTQEAIERAGIVVAPVTGGDGPSSIRVTGIVEPNGYRRVVVTPLVAGRVTQISAELGQRVRRGQSLATIYSPDLVDAHARLQATRAALQAILRGSVRRRIIQSPRINSAGSTTDTALEKHANAVSNASAGPVARAGARACTSSAR